MASPGMFNQALQLFLKKWKQRQSDQTIVSFIDHFKSEWIKSTNDGWCEGASVGIPSTDNG